MNAFILFLIVMDLMVIIVCVTCILVPRVLRHFGGIDEKTERFYKT